MVASVVQAAGIEGGSGLLGSGLNAIMTWKGMKMQRKENRRVEGINRTIRQQDMFTTERYRREDKKERDMYRDDQLKTQKYNRMLDVVNRVTSLMNRQPQLAANMIAMNRSRA